ncbi:hypothetical protein P5673_033222 [Acropora cervicornis]|uniref:Uncharacterized protein n=1 Tax=Acropora cervicornis TaxID=6130 RepID=A0AAD9UR94_ACRCE|nr:hypothetical protein P5673_033222 [Acropora cervicornis]
MQLAKNVKIVEPNETVIYACPITSDVEKDPSLLFVAPKALDVKAGDILSSPQAGGIMHKIVNAVNDGPFKVLLSSPAGLQEVIDYADFKEELSLLSLDDELTLEDEPDEQDLHELVSGNITVNGSRLIILPSGSATYKCLGHTYNVDNLTVHSYHLVLDKLPASPNIGDIIVANESSGFIETVIRTYKTDEAQYLETRLLQCTDHFPLNKTSLQLSHQHFEKASFCSGGDNNPGLLVLPNEKKEHQFAVNDSIIGRPSQGFIAKVRTQTESLRTTQQFFQIFEVAFSLPNKNTCNYLEKRL